MMKDQKGITLVALIITIIVMLILVGVSISVALNGGLFDKAREAKSSTYTAQLQEAATLAKAEVLMEYYADGANAAAMNKAMTKSFANRVAGYLGDEWKTDEGVSTISATATTDGEDFNVTGTVNGNTYTVQISIEEASGNS